MLCPTCKTETRNRTKKGALRYYLCTKCDQTFRTREVVINPEEEIVAAYDKVREYLATHKKPSTVTELSKHFLLARETIGKALRRLEDEGYAQRIRTNAGQHWTIQESRSERPARHVAVPQNIRPVSKVIQPTNPQTSYPHVRGYDD